jgi:membrane protease YdiL (CAAX protease family)
MLETIEILLILLGTLIVLRGLFFSFLTRNNIKALAGIGFYSSHMVATVFFLLLTILLYSVLFIINNKLALINFELRFNSRIFFQEIVSNSFSSFFEEVLFRLFFFIGLVDIIKNRVVLLILSSLIFSATHFPSNTILVVSYFLGGIVYGYSYLKFQNFWIPVVIHFAWNFTQGSIFGFPVSGNPSYGVFNLQITENILWNGEPHGPEGSVAGLVIRLILLFAIFFYPFCKLNSQFLNFENQTGINN